MHLKTLAPVSVSGNFFCEQLWTFLVEVVEHNFALIRILNARLTANVRY